MHEDMMDWFGEEFDPKAFEPLEVTHLLQNQGL